MSKSESNNIHVDSPPNYSVHQHACITLFRTDRLRCFQFPLSIINIVRDTINASWVNGLQKETQNIGFYEFKFKGNPWLRGGDENIPAQIVILHILSALHSNGWHLLTSNDFCRLLEDNNSFIFQLGVRPSPTLFFAISRYDLDKLHVICAPSDVIQRIRQTFGENNIQREEWSNGTRTCYRLKLSGKPWTNDETVSSRIRLLSLLDCFTSLDCQLHTGICMNGIIDSAEADTWIFRRKIQ
ncbi:unnamed protein product [Adineta steineri]|uniref:Uncharacterized protein n=1 Tax=Adineta steineri TaxID=433720 RepID=A0A815BI57_9BILA|nr:unnamed protein product [Adineta steineri]